MPFNENSGKVIIFSAPSGAGKTTITHHVLKTFRQLEFSISATTRSPRGMEKEGVDYYYLSAEEFREKIIREEFVEWEEVYSGNFYGTLKSEVSRIWNKNHHVVFDVDVKGGIHLKKIYGKNALSIFVMPPSLDVLEKRLRKRGTESEEAIHARVAKAFFEIDFYKEFDVIIINDRLITATSDTENVVRKFLNSER